MRWRDLFRATAAAAALSAAPVALAQPAPTPAPSASAPAPPAILEAEVSDIATLPAEAPHWVYVQDGPSARIVDADAGKMLGMVQLGPSANFARDPAGRHYYVSETIWTRVTRGARQDLLTIYDARTLNLVTEIALPGRLLVGGKRHTFAISPSGQTAFVYNMEPASSVVVVDLAGRKVAGHAELPGCGLIMPTGDSRFTSLCSDGTFASVTLDAAMKPTIKRSAKVFDAQNDPIFDNGVLDPATGEGTFLTYSGLVYQAALAGEARIQAPWSLQAAAGLARADARPAEVNWRPGGRQPLAIHRATGRAYVLMHPGEHWSQKQGGAEFWVVDIPGRKVVARRKLEKPATSIAISQDATPLLYVNGEGGDLIVLDPVTGKKIRSMERIGGGLIMAPGA